MNTIKFLRKNKGDVLKVIHNYFENFIDEEGCFDEAAYEDSAMEGELVDEINGEFFDEEDSIMEEDEYNIIDQYVDEVLTWEGMEEIKEYFDGF